MRTVADYRQLNDALFHAGSIPAASIEWEDTPNRLHFYIIDVQTTAAGRSFLHARRAVAGRRRPAEARRFARRTCHVSRYGSSRAMHVQTDEYRCGGGDRPGAASVGRDGVFGQRYLPVCRCRLMGAVGLRNLQNTLAAVKFGESTSIPVVLTRGPVPAIVTLTAQSESDSSKTATVTYRVSNR